MMIWEGRTLSYEGRNVVVLEKLGRSGMVIVAFESHPYMRVMVHRSQLRYRVPKKRKGNKR